jgi:hypothetical protein
VKVANKPLAGMRFGLGDGFFPSCPSRNYIASQQSQFSLFPSTE